MSIVEGTQQRMFAFPAGPAAPRGQLSGRSEWKGAEGRREARTTIKKRKRLLFQALSYRHLKAGGLSQASEAWRGGRRSPALPSISPSKGCLRRHSSNVSAASYHPAIHLPASTALQTVTVEFL